MNTILFLLMYGHTVRMILIGILIVLQVLDLWTTYVTLKSGKGYEANPIASLVLKKGKWWAMVGFKAFVIAALLKWGVYSSNSLLAVIAVVYTGVVANNYRIYKK